MDNKITTKEWLPLIGMTVAAFMFNTSEFMPIGLLMDIAADFAMTEAQAGLLITIYAYVVMLMSLPLMILASRYPLRKLLLATISLFAVSHVASAFAGGFWTLMLSRVGVAFAHSIFWSVASPIAVRLVRGPFKALAMSMIVTGTAIAIIVGLPLGRIIGLYIGWRMAFMCIAVIAFAVLAYMFFVFPKLEEGEPFTLGQLPVLLRNSVLIGLYVMSFLLPTGYYTAYSYIEPFLKLVAGMDEGWITVTLVIFGAAGLLGSMAFSKWYDKCRFNFFRGTVLGVAVVLLLLYPLSFNHYVLLALCAIWGIFVTAFNVVGQAELLRTTSVSTSAVAMSIYSGIFNLGIGSGSYLGGQISTHLSMAYIGFGGGAIVLLSFAYCTLRLVRNMQRMERQQAAGGQ